jgi:hypothetical protein
MGTPEQRTKEGYELQFATNHLGHFALTFELHRALTKAGQARIICVSSTAHLFSPVVFDDLHFAYRPYDPLLAYRRGGKLDFVFFFFTSNAAASASSEKSKSNGRGQTTSQRAVAVALDSGRCPIPTPDPRRRSRPPPGRLRRDPRFSCQKCPQTSRQQRPGSHASTTLTHCCCLAESSTASSTSWVR